MTSFLALRASVCAYLLCLISPGNVLRVSVAEWTLPLDHHLLCLLRPSAARWSSGFRIESAALTLIIFSHLSGPNFAQVHLRI